MIETPEAPICACTVGMTLIKSDIFACMNCDRVQEREAKSQSRLITAQDVLYAKVMYRREYDWYPEQRGG